jgi:hypothetical protein
MSDGSGARKEWNVFVWDARGVQQIVGESAETGPEDDSNARPKPGLRQ